jgi:hypothetical protein
LKDKLRYMFTLSTLSVNTLHKGGESGRRSGVEIM